MPKAQSVEISHYFIFSSFLCPGESYDALAMAKGHLTGTKTLREKPQGPEVPGCQGGEEKAPGTLPGRRVTFSTCANSVLNKVTFQPKGRKYNIRINGVGHWVAIWKQ